MLTRSGDLRVGLDGFNLALPQGTGVATYARVLGETLARTGCRLDGVFGVSAPKDASQALREIVFLDRLEQAPGPPPRTSLAGALRRAVISPWPRRAVEIEMGAAASPRAYPERLPPFSRILSYGGLFSVAARHFRRYRRFLTLTTPSPPQVMHWTYPLPVRLAGARNIYTIHDLVPLRLPQASLEDKAYHHRLVAGCLNAGDHICTVSDASRRDILQMFPQLSPDRITNTYQAVQPDPSVLDLGSEALGARLQALFDLQPDGYFLHYGALEPKKNLGRVLEAYLLAGTRTPLVVVGSAGWKAADELRLLNGAHGVALTGLSGVRRLDYLPRSLLMLLVRGARAVLFPSLWEGFGLPVVEAMAMGAPVLTSTTSAMPEIAGEAACLVDPYDVAQIQAGLEALDRDPALRARLRHEGRANVTRFSAEAYAKRLGELYAAVLADGPSRGRSVPAASSARRWRVEAA